MHEQLSMIASQPDAVQLPLDESKRKTLGQYMTPAWAAELLVAQFFGDLTSHDFVVEPSCGVGRFLQAIPADVPAIGVEIDPKLAEMARQITKRTVITGDFRTVELPDRPSVCLGNPPYELELIDQFLDRAYSLLKKDGVVGWILPAYAFQTAGRVCRYNERWSLQQTMMPRNIFQGLKEALCWAVFRKDEQRRLEGFILYPETVAVKQLPDQFRHIFESADGPVWRRVTARALRELGGTATVDQICRVVEGYRPTATAFWKQAIRKNLQQYFPKIDHATYSLPIAA